jgi:hypothetical protein
MNLSEVKTAILSTYPTSTDNQVNTLTQADVDSIEQLGDDFDTIEECYTLAVENLELIIERAKEKLKDNRNAILSIDHGIYTILENRIEIPTAIMRGDVEDRWVGADNDSLLQGETTRIAIVYHETPAEVTKNTRAMKLKATHLVVIDDNDWDELITQVYSKPYCLQQQGKCRSRGFIEFTPFNEWNDDELNAHKSIPEVLNGGETGIAFDVWLSRDPKEPLNPTKLEFNTAIYPYKDISMDDYCKDSKNITDFWVGSFYPCLQSLADDLCNKGILEKGVKYAIKIDW